MRKKPWPIGKEIMLYHWQEKPYRSKHQDIAVVKVISTNPIFIKREQDDSISYIPLHPFTLSRPLWQHEGFDSQEEMDAWFRPLIKINDAIHRHLMHFKLIRPA
jgi:hypothetical protein